MKYIYPYMNHILLILIVIMSSFTKMVDAQCFSDERLTHVFDFEIEKRFEKDYIEKEQVISIVFYKIGNSEFFSLTFYPLYNAETFKGYCSYKDYIVVYEGIDESVSNKLINQNQFIKTTENIDSLKWDLSIYDPYDNQSFYKITKRKLIKFHPSKKHIELLRCELNKAGNILTPPPPPLK